MNKKRNILKAQTMATVIWGRVGSQMFLCSQSGGSVSSGYSSQGGDKAQAWWDIVVHGPNRMVVGAS